MKKRLTKLLIPMLASAGMMTVMAVETGALPPVYNNYVYDALKNNYLVIQDVKQDTASMSIGASTSFIRMPQEIFTGTRTPMVSSTTVWHSPTIITG